MIIKMLIIFISMNSKMWNLIDHFYIYQIMCINKVFIMHMGISQTDMCLGRYWFVIQDNGTHVDQGIIMQWCPQFVSGWSYWICVQVRNVVRQSLNLEREIFNLKSTHFDWEGALAQSLFCRNTIWITLLFRNVFWLTKFPTTSCIIQWHKNNTMWV